MSWIVQTLDEIHETMLAHIRGRSPGANVAVGSPRWLRTRAVAAIAFTHQQGTLEASKQILPSTADASFLPEHARNRMGESGARLPASKASGKVMVLAAADAIAIGTSLVATHPSGQSYTVIVGGVTATPAFSGKTVALGSSTARLVVDPHATDMDADDIVSVGSVDVVRAIRDVLPDVGTEFAIDFYQRLVVQPTIGGSIAPVCGVIVTFEADLAGAAGNLLPGDVITLSSPPTDVTAACVVLEMTGGGDLETTEQQRARILAWMAERPGSGNRSDFRQWARATPDVRLDDACVFVGYRGIGTIDVVPIGITGARQTGPTVNAAVLAYLVSQASDFDDIGVRQLVDGDSVDVTLELDAGEPDWRFGTGPSSGYDIDSGSTETTVVLTDAPDEMSLGDRVLVPVTTGIRPGLYQRTVTGIDLGAKTITLDEELPAEPSAGSVVDPGSAASGDVIDAVLAYFDALGPGDPTTGTRFPEASEAWEWTVRPERLSDVALDVDGVEGCVVTDPSAAVSGAQFARLVLGGFRILHA